MAQDGPEKLLFHVGISSSGSSMPSTMAPLISHVPLSIALLPSQTVYTIPCTKVEDVQCGVEIINDCIKGILELFNGISGGDKP